MMRGDEQQNECIDSSDHQESQSARSIDENERTTTGMLEGDQNEATNATEAASPMLSSSDFATEKKAEPPNFPTRNIDNHQRQRRRNRNNRPESNHNNRAARRAEKLREVNSSLSSQPPPALLAQLPANYAASAFSNQTAATTPNIDTKAATSEMSSPIDGGHEDRGKLTRIPPTLSIVRIAESDALAEQMMLRRTHHKPLSSLSSSSSTNDNNHDIHIDVAPNQRQPEKRADIRVVKGPTLNNIEGLLAILLITLQIEQWDVNLVRMDAFHKNGNGSSGSCEEENFSEEGKEKQSGREREGNTEQITIVVSIPSSTRVKSDTQSGVLIHDLRSTLRSVCNDFISRRRSILSLLRAFEATTFEPDQLNRSDAAQLLDPFLDGKIPSPPQRSKKTVDDENNPARKTMG